jgi:hypothetical protein
VTAWWRLTRCERPELAAAVACGTPEQLEGLLDAELEALGQYAHRLLETSRRIRVAAHAGLSW